jgi:hypothetical protein
MRHGGLFQVSVRASSRPKRNWAAHWCDSAPKRSASKEPKARNSCLENRNRPPTALDLEALDLDRWARLTAEAIRDGSNQP